MSDEINNSCGINYDLLCNAGGKVWKINTFGATENLMHNKFCIIDNSTVINGSYNWTKKAQHNHESITIISENIELALQFSDEFRSIKEKYFGKDTESIVVDFGIICSRLSTLKELFALAMQRTLIILLQNSRNILSYLVIQSFRQ